MNVDETIASISFSVKTQFIGMEAMMSAEGYSADSEQVKCYIKHRSEFKTRHCTMRKNGSLWFFYLTERTYETLKYFKLDARTSQFSDEGNLQLKNVNCLYSFTNRTIKPDSIYTGEVQYKRSVTKSEFEYILSFLKHKCFNLKNAFLVYDVLHFFKHTNKIIAEHTNDEINEVQRQIADSHKVKIRLTRFEVAQKSFDDILAIYTNDEKHELGCGLIDTQPVNYLFQGDADSVRIEGYGSEFIPNKVHFHPASAFSRFSSQDYLADIHSGSGRSFMVYRNFSLGLVFWMMHYDIKYRAKLESTAKRCVINHIHGDSTEKQLMVLGLVVLKDIQIKDIYKYTSL